MQVRITADAKIDLARPRAFLADKNERAAIAATDALLAAVESLEHFPERGRRGRGLGGRELVIRCGRDGYVIRDRATPEVVIVTRIFHGRERQEANWSDSITTVL